MKKVSVILLILFVCKTGFAQEVKQPTAPVPPAEPAKPSDSGTTGRTDATRFPPVPNFPVMENQPNGAFNGQVYETEKYDLNVTRAYTNGNTRNNAANSIFSAQYTLYSNKTITIKLEFMDGSVYTYHLRNPGEKVEISNGNFRETFDTLVQVGTTFLMERYSSELTYTPETITSLNLIGDNRTVVQLVFSKKEQ